MSVINCSWVSVTVLFLDFLLFLFVYNILLSVTVQVVITLMNTSKTLLERANEKLSDIHMTLL